MLNPLSFETYEALHSSIPRWNSYFNGIDVDLKSINPIFNYLIHENTHFILSAHCQFQQSCKIAYKNYLRKLFLCGGVMTSFFRISKTLPSHHVDFFNAS